MAITANYYLALLALSLSFSMSSCSPRLGGKTLDLSGVPIVVAGRCCPIAGAAQPCNPDSCPLPDADAAGNVADGDAFTEWRVDFTSSLPDGAQPEASFTLEFGQPYRLYSVALLSTTEPLPSEWRVSTGPGKTLSAPAKTSAEVYQQTVVLEEEQRLPTSQLEVTVSLPSAAAPDSIAIAEIFIVVNDSDLPNDVGCGACVDQLTAMLSLIVPDVRNSSSTLDSLVNQTQIRLLSEGITRLESSTERYEDFLRVVGVVLGTTPPLEENATIVETVPRLDLTLAPPIPSKLGLLEELVNGTSQLELDLSELRSNVEEIVSDLADVEELYLETNSSVTSFLSNFSALMEDLVGHTNNVMSALSQAQVIHEFVMQTNFSRELEDLAAYAFRVDVARNSSVDFLFTANRTLGELMELEVFASTLKGRLEEAVETIGRLYNESLGTLVRVDMTDSLVEQTQDLVSVAHGVNSSIAASIAVIRMNLNNYSVLITALNSSILLIRDLHAELRSRLDLLEAQIDEYALLLSPYQLPPGCNLSLPCAQFEIYAYELFRNASDIANSDLTNSTLSRAISLLFNVNERRQLFDYTAVNETAIRARETAGLVIPRLEGLMIGELIDELVRTVEPMVIALEETSARLLSQVNDSLFRSKNLQQSQQMLQMLLDEQLLKADEVQTEIDVLSRDTGLVVEARQLLLQAEEALNLSIKAERRITDIEATFEGVANDISQTRANVAEATDILASAENKFGTIALLLNQTRDMVPKFEFNTTTFIAENDRLIGEIDDIISGLSDIHRRLNRINSPIQLSDQGSEGSYLSLQPPLGRIINDSIQFESMELFFGTSSAFTVPSLLFYAGPVYDSVEDPISAASTSEEDYFLLTVEDNNNLQLRYRMGSESGTLTATFTQGFENWVVVTRHGSWFELRYGTLTLDKRDFSLVNSNGSVVFRVSDRTAFLVGGWPSEAQLGVPGTEIDLSRYSSFQGLFHLILFNGEQWGLWNIRGSSDTSFIGLFQKNSLASRNLWNPRESLSFDGSGYLFVDQLLGVNEQTILLILRASVLPRDDKDALIFYAYDSTTGFSFEAAYVRNKVQARVYDHSDNKLILDQIPTDPAPVLSNQVTYSRLANSFFAVDSSLISAENFFNDLRNVRAWVGGVKEDMLQHPFVPQLSNGSFHGCIDMGRLRVNSYVPLFDRSSYFLTRYLGSPVQKGFSGTCLKTTYVSKVGFSGAPDAYLSYTYLLLHKPSDDPNVYNSVLDGRSIISFSVRPNEVKGLLFAAIGRQGEDSLAIYFVGSQIVAEVQKSNNSVVLRTSPVTAGEWHEVMLESLVSELNLHLDGHIEDQSPPLSGFRLDILNANDGSGDKVIFVGGGPATLLPSLADKVFSGCINDLAINFHGVELLSEALASDRLGIEGVSYNTCPFFKPTSQPLLAVHPVDPTVRSCFSSVPQSLPGTHGAFHMTTSLTTSNVIGLLKRSWSLSFSLRQFSDGHVLSIPSAVGHMITLVVSNGYAQLTLLDGGPLTNVSDHQLPNGIFVPLVINCEVLVADELLMCSLSVGGSPGMNVSISYTAGATFFPSLPIQLGAVTGRDSFVGCIQDLAVDGDSRGFNLLSTGIDCYSVSRAGLGFSSISHIELPLAEVSDSSYHMVSFEFQPQVDNGLLLLLSGSNGSIPALAVGMFNGDLKLSGPGSAVMNLITVCSTVNPLVHRFSLQYNTTHAEMSVGIDGGGAGSGLNSTVIPFTAGQEPLVLAIGGISDNLVVLDSTDYFGFLLTDDRPQGSVPPGFTGCITNITVNSLSLSAYGEVVMEEVQDGYCSSS